MLLRRLLRRAAYCVALGSMVIRSTRRDAPYPHTAVGVGARLEPGAGGAGGGLGSRAGGRRLLRCGAGGLHPGTTRSSASARRAAQDETGWASNFCPGFACAHRSHCIARSVTVEYVLAWIRTTCHAPLAQFELHICNPRGDRAAGCPSEPLARGLPLQARRARVRRLS